MQFLSERWYLDVIDIAIVAFIFYKLFMLVKGTRASQMFAGLVMLVVASLVAQWFQLNALNWIVNSLKTVWVIAFGLLVVVFFAAQIVLRTSAFAPAGSDAMAVRNLAGSDWIERHPNGFRSNYFSGSDWIERHSPVLRSNYFAGSDYIERHPPVVLDAKAYAGSDWIERHPSNYYTGSDLFERHPIRP